MKKLGFKSLVFGSRLRELRKERGIKGPQKLSALMEGAYSVTAILRREEGRLKIDEEYLTAFCKAVGLSSDEQRLLRSQFRIGNHKADQSWAEIEQEYAFITRNSKCIYNFRSATLPTELQTLEYAHAVAGALDKGDFKERIKRNMELKKELMEKKDLEIKILCPEWTLYIPYGSPRIMLDQMVALREYEGHSPIEFRILPWSAFPNVPIGRGYKIYDHSFCRSASRLEITTMEDQDRVGEVESEFKTLWELGAAGDARKLLLEKSILHYKGLVQASLL